MPGLKINYSTVANEKLASFRYRIKIPAKYLSDWGHEVVIGEPERADVGVFSKHFNANDYEIARQPTRYGRVVFDVCDYHLEGPHRKHYERMIHLADTVTVGTEEMGRLIEEELGIKSTVIYDPYEFSEQEPRYDNNSRLLWFGHPSNLMPLANEIKGGALSGYWLKVISHGNDLMPVTVWSMESMKEGLDECDIVIIPQEDSKQNRCKGANRMVEAIRSGRFVIANSMPAYEQFKEWMYIGDIQEGLIWAMNNESQITDRIREAQTYVKKTFSPRRISSLWESSLTSDVAIST